MSVFFGVVGREGQPASNGATKAMYRSVADCPHLDVNYRVQGNVGMGFMTTALADTGCAGAPLFLSERRLLILAKGRLDNRGELRHALGAPTRDGEPDGNLIAKCYAKWGSNTPARLLGDWALAAFHVDTQELFLARDQHGYTQLAYYEDDSSVAFSTNLRAILALPWVSKQPEAEAVVRSQVLYTNDGGHLSWYRGVFQVPPGAWVTLSREKGPKTTRYWFPERVSVNRRLGAEDCLRETERLLKVAVSDRIRGKGRPISTLSGGLDSSTVSFLAAEFGAARLRTLSHVPAFPPTTGRPGQRFGDESSFIRQIVAASGRIEPTFLDSRDTHMVASFRKMSQLVTAPLHGAVNTHWLLDVAECAKTLEGEVLLTGEMGNATLSRAGLPQALPLPVALAQHGLGRTLRNRLARPLYLNARAAALRRFPTTLALRRLGFLNVQHIRTLPIYERLSSERFVPGERRLFRDGREQAMAIMNVGCHSRGWIGSMLGDAYGLEFRDPLSDRRLLEFTLSIPEELYFDVQGRTRALVRGVMRGKLPDSVLDTGGKGLQGADVGTRLQREKVEIEQKLLTLEQSNTVRTFLDVQRMRRAWRQIQSVQDHRFGREVDNFTRTLMAGMFLAEFDSH